MNKYKAICINCIPWDSTGSIIIPHNKCIFNTNNQIVSDVIMSEEYKIDGLNSWIVKFNKEEEKINNGAVHDPGSILELEEFLGI